MARPSEEEFLKYFFVGTRTVSPADQITNIEDPPMDCQRHVRAAQARGLGWTAWATARGPMVAWATYDIEGSQRLKMHVLHFEWFLPPSEYHRVWCRCDPHRPTEWIFGRGALEERH